MQFNVHKQEAPATLRVIDISKVSKPFRDVGNANYLLFAAGGSIAIGAMISLFSAKSLIGALGWLFKIAFFSECARMAWKNTDAVATVKNKLTYFYLAAFAVLGLILLLVGIKVDTEKDIFFGGIMLLLPLLGLFYLLRLRRKKLPILGVRLVEFLHDAALHPVYEGEKLPAQNSRKGLWLVIGGLIYLICTSLLWGLLPFELQKSSGQVWYAIDSVGLGMLIMARQCFQPSFETVIEHDHRAPVLFLRSFADDEKLKFGRRDQTILDFSLESRLAKHFYGFGPFIGIGAPGETAKGMKASTHLGAARVQLSDDVWQSAVENWMDQSTLILCMAGWSEWVVWEMKKIIERGHTNKLLLILPEVKLIMGKRKKDISKRIDRIREAFSGTLWEAALAGIEEPDKLRCLVFSEQGEVTAIISKPRVRDSYHLAAVLGHALLLGVYDSHPLGAMSDEAPELSGMIRRAVAAIVDADLIFFTALALQFLLPWNSFSDSVLQIYGLWTLLLLFAEMVLLAVVYYTVMEGWLGATLGKMLAGIEVRNKEGGPCSWKASALRNLMRPVDAVGFYLLGFVSAALSKQQQTFGDRIGSTVVMEKNWRSGLRWSIGIYSLIVFLVGISAAIKGGGSLIHAPASALSSLPYMVAVERQGELNVGNLRYFTGKDNSENSSIYETGQAANVSYEIARFGRDASGAANLLITYNLLDPSGKKLEEPETLQFHDAISAAERVSGQWGDLIPAYAPAGKYLFDINVQDKISGAKIHFQPSITVQGLTQVCMQPTIDGLYLSSVEDGPKIDSEAVQRGQSIYTHLTICGLDRKNSHLNARVSERITNPSGAVLWDDPSFIEDRKEVFYYPSTFEQDYIGSALKIPKGCPKGVYRIEYHLVDNFSGKTGKGEFAFRVE